MSVKVYTNFGVLLRLARALAVAERTGDVELIKKAKFEHDQYKELCISADEMLLNTDYGSLL